MTRDTESMTDTEVWIETTDMLPSDGRQIGPRRRITELLADRRADIRNAIAQAAEVVQGSVEQLPARDGWQVENVQAKFAVKLAAQAGVVLSKASSEASFEIVVTVSRVPADE
jgi:hypothetical protein